jgi:glutamate racemase
VIRPTTEIIGQFSKTGHIGILGTTGTVNSGSYVVEINKFYPHLQVYQEACPMWVPLIENNEINNPGADYFIRQHVDQLMKKQPQIDAIILACTHYPLITPAIKKFLPPDVELLSQGRIVAASLYDYLQRHPEIEVKCSKGGSIKFLTTDQPEPFNAAASTFYGSTVRSSHISF